MPFLKNPGYGKLQIGIYIAAVEDALGRHRLEKSLSTPVSPPDDGDGQDPGGKDNENSNDSDDEDHLDDQHKSKRRRGRDGDGRGAANSSVLNVRTHKFLFHQTGHTYSLQNPVDTVASPI